MINAKRISNVQSVGKIVIKNLKKSSGFKIICFIKFLNVRILKCYEKNSFKILCMCDLLSCGMSKPSGQ